MHPVLFHTEMLRLPTSGGGLQVKQEHPRTESIKFFQNDQSQEILHMLIPREGEIGRCIAEKSTLGV